MADKEATVYVVDVGKSMGEERHGRDVSDLEFAMKYVWDKLATTVASGRKTFNAGVVAFRTNGTSNELGDQDGYERISVLQPIAQILMPQLRDLKTDLVPSQTDEGDAISALVIAVQMIIAHCKQLKWHRKIILVTNGSGAMDDDEVSAIASKLKADQIQLTVLGVDFDDAEFGVKEEDKDAMKERNERVLQTLVDESGGVFGTMAQAVEELTIPRVKTVRPVASFKGKLTLGDTSQYETALAIDVERYPRVMAATAPTASMVVLKSVVENASQNEPRLGDGEHGDDINALASVKQARTYQVKDESAPGGKREVDRDELAKGYEYGRTAVAISESEENVTKLETTAGLEIVGFVPRDKFERYMSMSRSSIIVPPRINERANMALSSFIHALYELDTCAVARFVVKDWKGPVLLLLSPLIEPDFECLVDFELPFAEDVRSYKFPSLERIITVSGKVLKEHRNLPTDALKIAMGDLVDNMDLSTYGKDDDGKPTEYMTMEETFNPKIHYINQSIRYRAVHPDEPVPKPPQNLFHISHPPEELTQSIAPILERIQKEANVKKVPPKSLSRRKFGRKRPQEAPRSGLDVAALLSTRPSYTTKKVSPENAIPEFKQILANADDINTVRSAITQLGSIIRDWITTSLGEANYGRAVEALRVMKEECIEMEEPEAFNSFLRELKEELLAGKLDGDRREMWWSIRANKLGLITKKYSSESEVTEEDAKNFLSAK